MKEVRFYSFKQDIANLISKKRIESYGGIDKHFANLHLIATITPKIATIEIALRNILDYCMIICVGDKWIENSNIDSIKEIRDKILEREVKTLQHHQYISKFTLGNVIKLIKEFELQNSICNVKNFDFKKYSKTNINYGWINGRKEKLSNISRVSIVLNLLSQIRNRSYHWENLNKTRKGKNGKEYPRITTKEQGAIISIESNNIDTFLTDFIISINKDLIQQLKLGIFT